MTARPKICALFALLPTLAALVAVPVSSSAETTSSDRTTAQALFDEGRRLMAEKRPNDACPKFEESAKLLRLSGTLLNLANCYEEQGRLAMAWSTFIAAATVSHRDGNLDREKEAQARGAALEPKLPRIVIQVGEAKDIAAIEIRRDDIPVGAGQWGVAIPADPGRHQIVATATGYTPWQTTVELRAAALVTVTIPRLLPLPHAQPQTLPQPVAATTSTGGVPSFVDLRATPNTSKATGSEAPVIVATSIAALGLATSGVFGWLSWQKHKSAEDHCDYDKCRDAQGVELRKDARTFGNIATGAAIAGAIGATTGVAFWLTSPKPQDAQRKTALGLGPNSVEFRGVW